MSGGRDQGHQVSVITARSSVIRGPAISDTEDRSEEVITSEEVIRLTDLGYSDPSDPDWSLPFKRKVLSHYLQRRSRLPNY